MGMDLLERIDAAGNQIGQFIKSTAIYVWEKIKRALCWIQDLLPFFAISVNSHGKTTTTYKEGVFYMCTPAKTESYHLAEELDNFGDCMKEFAATMKSGASEEELDQVAEQLENNAKSISVMANAIAVAVEGK